MAAITAILSFVVLVGWASPSSRSEANEANLIGEWTAYKQKYGETQRLGFYLDETSIDDNMGILF